MLVLGRKLGERILIQTPQGDIWIAVMDIDRGTIRLGITAPKSLRIDREELLRQGTAQDDAPRDEATGNGKPGEG